MTADLLRHALEMKRANTRLSSADTKGRFTGYASMFDEVDLGRDRIAHGAFALSLSTKGPNNIRMLFQHDPDKPIGAWQTIQEDGLGLRVAGQLAIDTPKGREVHELLKLGAVDGLSIGFKTVRARTDATTGIRTILEADLWEISVVTFPMLPSARIESVKSHRQPTIREFERFLVRDAGLTRSEAKRVITHGYSNLTEARDASVESPWDAANEAASLSRHIRAAARRLMIN